jgi:hypothetical protein
MKSVAAPAVLALVLAVAGGAFWTTGQTARRLADAHKALATLQYTDASDETNEVDRSVMLGRRVQSLTGDPTSDARDVRATAQYWRSDYGGLNPQKDATGTITETDPQILLLAANASFRASQADADRNTTLRRLDAVVKSYAEVLKSNPGQADAAYNYEYAVRVRDNLSKARSTPPPSKSAQALKTAENTSEQLGDLPSGPTLHGRPGGPPPKSDMAQFKIVIPKRGEERKDDPQAGKGGVKVRKG